MVQDLDAVTIVVSSSICRDACLQSCVHCSHLPILLNASTRCRKSMMSFYIPGKQDILLE